MTFCEQTTDTNCLTLLGRGVAKFQSVFASQRSVTIATLGPDGTSSAEAARALIRCGPEAGTFSLHPTYEEAASAVILGASDYLVVANAYSLINHFYISPHLVVVGAFPWPTPPYGVAVDVARMDHDSAMQPILVSHPAPAHLVEQWFQSAPRKPTVVLARSTSEAALAVANGQALSCITTDVARRRCGLAFITQTQKIQMLWSIFARRDHPSADCLFGGEHG